MAESSITAALAFESYKVDFLQIQMRPNLELLAFNGQLDPSLWDVRIALRTPTFFKQQNQYVGGVEILMNLFATQDEKEKEKSDAWLISAKISIAGLFKTDKSRLDAEAEKKMVKINIPATLMPYARSALTAAFAVSGFGTVTVPLVNVAQLAAESTIEIQVKE